MVVVVEDVICRVLCPDNRYKLRNQVFYFTGQERYFSWSIIGRPVAIAPNFVIQIKKSLAKAAALNQVFSLTS